MILPAYQTAFG